MKLSNLILPCRFHHRQVHEDGVTVQMLNDGALWFGGARGIRFEVQTYTEGDAHVFACRHQLHGIDVDVDASMLSCGDRIDFGPAVEGLLAQQQLGPVPQTEKMTPLKLPDAELSPRARFQAQCRSRRARLRSHRQL
jgi:hypothetical protein